MRRGSPEVRPITPDMRYNSVQLQTLVQHVVKRGKKSTAVNVMYDSLDLVRERSGGKDPVEIFDTAMRNVAPSMEVKPRRVGGATYQVPMEVAPVRRTTLAIRWVLDSAKARAGKSFAEKLADEILDAAKNEGASIRKREETHKMAEANKAFAHFAW